MWSFSTTGSLHGSGSGCVPTARLALALHEIVHEGRGVVAKHLTPLGLVRVLVFTHDGVLWAQY